MNTVILKTSLVGARGSYGPGDSYTAATEKEANRMVEAGQAEWPKEDQADALKKALEGEAAAKAEAEQLRAELEKLKTSPPKATAAKTTAKPKEDGAK